MICARAELNFRPMTEKRLFAQRYTDLRGGPDQLVLESSVAARSELSVASGRSVPPVTPIWILARMIRVDLPRCFPYSRCIGRFKST